MSKLPALTPPRLPQRPALGPADLIAGLAPDPLDPLLTRPLALLNGRAYAAVWPRLRRDPADPTASSHGPEFALAQALPTLLIVRDDGLISAPVSPADILVRLASHRNSCHGRRRHPKVLEVQVQVLRVISAAKFDQCDLLTAAIKLG